MEPSQLLVGLLVGGAIGALVLTASFLGLLSAAVECPECSSRQHRRSAYCQRCGVPMASARGKTTTARRRDTAHNRDDDDERVPIDEVRIQQLARTIGRLSTAEKQLLQQHLEQNEPGAEEVAGGEWGSSDRTPLSSVRRDVASQAR